MTTKNRSRFFFFSKKSNLQHLLGVGFGYCPHTALSEWKQTSPNDIVKSLQEDEFTILTEDKMQEHAANKHWPRELCNALNLIPEEEA